MPKRLISAYISSYLIYKTISTSTSKKHGNHRIQNQKRLFVNQKTFPHHKVQPRSKANSKFNFHQIRRSFPRPWQNQLVLAWIIRKCGLWQDHWEETLSKQQQDCSKQLPISLFFHRSHHMLSEWSKSDGHWLPDRIESCPYLRSQPLVF